ncbi:MAG: Superoxide dismutase [Planctomycetota bacterium]|jgi:Fe-Mn family superoxide dismutase
MSMDRRQFLGSTLALAATAGWGRVARAAAAEYTLPALPYAFTALEPHIDAMTMEIHHDRHHAGYVKNLNAALADHPSLQGKPVEELLMNLKDLPAAIQTAVRNNGGGHYNHTLFWSIMAPDAGGQPKGKLAAAIGESFNGFDAFKAQLTDAAVKRFGSGWGWLSVGKDGKLVISSSANQDNPVMEGATPILGVDVWEHAYYLKYQNKRPDYVSAWWHTINWAEVAKRYDMARG